MIASHASLHQRQGDRETSAFPDFRLDFDFPAVLLGDVACDGQSEAHALAAPTHLPSVETIEDVREVPWCDPATGIDHAYLDHITQCGAVDLHHAGLRSELEGVVQKDKEELTQVVLISVNHRLLEAVDLTAPKSPFTVSVAPLATQIPD